jgi:spermidine/putrescine transport system ATP-binding protein
VRLASGDLVEFETPVKGDVTLTIRPEQLRLLPASEPGAIAATIANLVYFGTDTHVHLELADRTELVARVQSPATGDAGLGGGTKVGVRFAPGALQIVGE